MCHWGMENRLANGPPSLSREFSEVKYRLAMWSRSLAGHRAETMTVQRQGKDRQTVGAAKAALMPRPVRRITAAETTVARDARTKARQSSSRPMLTEEFG